MTFTLIGSAFASHDSEESIEEIRAGCREDNILVFRLVNHAYVCTSPLTATSWTKLGIAEIVPDTILETVEKQPESTKPESTKPESTKEIKDENQEKDITESKIAINVSDKQNIVLPPYPEQPSINPELLATNGDRYPRAVHKVNERIWVAVGYDSANSVMIEGEKGIIIIDTLSTYESAKNVLHEFRKITNKPVKTIIYTSSNLESVGGTRAFLEEGDNDVEIISHENHLNSYINQNMILGEITGLRSQYATGSFLPEDGPDKNNLGRIPKFTSSTITYVPPTDTFSDKFDLDISDVKITLIHIGGESSDKIYVWLPNEKSMVIGDNIYGIFPNTHTIRGGSYNDPMNYVSALDKIILLEPESLILSHVKPIIGKKDVNDILVTTRDATQYIHDQTVRGINNGYTADELSNMIKLPSSLENHPWLTYQKGQVPWNVKQIYYGTLGGFEGDPGFLQSVSMDKRSSKIIDGFGGPENALLDVRNAIKDGEYEWAYELVTYVLNVDPKNTEAKLLKAHTLRVLGQRMLSFDARQLAITNALELEGKITVNQDIISQINSGQLDKIPIEKVLNILPTKLKSDKADRIYQSVDVFYPDIEKSFTLHFRHNILVITEGSDEHSRYKLVLDTKTHKSIISGDLQLIDAINSKQIEFQGDIDNILYLMGLIQDSSDGIPTKFKTL